MCGYRAIRTSALQSLAIRIRYDFDRTAREFLATRASTIQLGSVPISRGKTAQRRQTDRKHPARGVTICIMLSKTHTPVRCSGWACSLGTPLRVQVRVGVCWDFRVGS